MESLHYLLCTCRCADVQCMHSSYPTKTVHTGCPAVGMLLHRAPPLFATFKLHSAAHGHNNGAHRNPKYNKHKCLTFSPSLFFCRIAKHSMMHPACMRYFIRLCLLQFYLQAINSVFSSPIYWYSSSHGCFFFINLNKCFVQVYYIRDIFYATRYSNSINYITRDEIRVK